MSDVPRTLFDLLSVSGSDLWKWPRRSEEAKAALLADPEFRRAWERERNLDRGLAEHRSMLDAEIAASEAPVRLSRALVRRVSNPLAGMDWRRIAAAVVIAGMLGGALDLMLPETGGDPVDIAIVDPLDLADAGVE